MIYNVCGRTELIRSLQRNRLKIEEVEEKLGRGYLNAKDLEDLAIYCNRVSYLSQEIIRQRNLKKLAEIQAMSEESSLQWE
jgi:hypothetical protein